MNLERNKKKNIFFFHNLEAFGIIYSMIHVMCHGHIFWFISSSRVFVVVAFFSFTVGPCTYSKHRFKKNRRICFRIPFTRLEKPVKISSTFAHTYFVVSNAHAPLVCVLHSFERTEVCVYTPKIEKLIFRFRFLVFICRLLLCNYTSATPNMRKIDEFGCSVNSAIDKINNYFNQWTYIEQHLEYWKTVDS